MTKQQLTHAVKFIFAWLVCLTMFVVPFVVAGTQASGGPVAAERTAVQTPPACMSEGYQGGYIEFNPSGTISATTDIAFPIPFCSPNYVLTANVVREINTNGKQISVFVKVYSSSVGSVTMELDAPSDAVFSAHWLAVMVEFAE